MQVSDLPRDPLGTLSSVRSKLTSLVNSSKHSVSKRALLKETLVCVLTELETQETPIIDDIIEAMEEEVVPAPEFKTKKRATAKVKKDAII
jgi:hypothetical protein